jgi:hypothetical protein
MLRPVSPAIGEADQFDAVAVHDLRRAQRHADGGCSLVSRAKGSWNFSA